MIWEIIILDIKSRQKAKGQNAVPHAKSKEENAIQSLIVF